MTTTAAPPRGGKRAGFELVNCPACHQNFKAARETVADMQLPRDCPICAEKANAADLAHQLIDPTAVIDPRKVLGRVLAIEANLTSIRSDLNTILSHLGLDGSGAAPVERGTGAVPELPI